MKRQDKDKDEKNGDKSENDDESGDGENDDNDAEPNEVNGEDNEEGEYRRVEGEEHIYIYLPKGFPEGALKERMPRDDPEHAPFVHGEGDLAHVELGEEPGQPGYELRNEDHRLSEQQLLLVVLSLVKSFEKSRVKLRRVAIFSSHYQRDYPPSKYSDIVFWWITIFPRRWGVLKKLKPKSQSTLMTISKRLAKHGNTKPVT